MPVTPSANGQSGWFADQPDKDDERRMGAWQPFVQIGTMGCFPLPIGFATEADCEQFIASELVGLGVLDD